MGEKLTKENDFKKLSCIIYTLCFLRELLSLWILFQDVSRVTQSYTVFLHILNLHVFEVNVDRTMKWLQYDETFYIVVPHKQPGIISNCFQVSIID